MRHPIVVGLQFGDEGKGKLTDYLASKAQWVLRFNGGSNAGHTLLVDGKKVVTHSVPSGVLYPSCKNYIGSGCVIEPTALKKEIQELKAAGIALEGRFWIDGRAHITTPLHLAIESLRESGDKKVGTTRKGIGPTYATKAFRVGIRAQDLLKKEKWQSRLEDLFESFGAMVQGLDVPEVSLEFNRKALEDAAQWMAPFVSDEPAPFYKVAREQRCVLEGAQAVMLDVDFGTYPYVTSSHTVGAYAGVGVPFPYSALGMSIGVLKAYTTRVGEGPFETELSPERSDVLRAKGGEFGATTGRTRRVGWLNLDELKHAVQVSDCTALFMTKSDILTGEDKLQVWVDGALKSLEPWDAVYSGEGLHPNLESYIQVIEKALGVPVIGVGTGPERESLYWRKKVDFWNAT